METIHQRIKRLREGKKLSQEDLGSADGVNVKYQSVQEWERDNGTAPSRKRLKAVAKKLGVTEQYLLSGDEPDGVQQPAVDYQSVSTRALEVARRFDRLSPACQEHVSAQVDLLASVKGNGDRARAAQHDVEIRGGTLQSKAARKRRRS